MASACLEVVGKFLHPVSAVPNSLAFTEYRKTNRCRRDRYVLSSLLESNKTIPPLCKEGTFCPDDASTCLPLVPVGGHCQLNRDGTFSSYLRPLYASYTELRSRLIPGQTSVCLQAGMSSTPYRMNGIRRRVTARSVSKVSACELF